jgi:hypothetical protein
MKTYFAVAALSFAFAGIAHADGAEYQLPEPNTSTVTRAQVIAEYLDARAKGQIETGERSLPRVEIASTSQRTRAEVKAETLQAIASGELRFLNQEPQSAFGVFQPKTAKSAPALVAANAK